MRSKPLFTFLLIIVFSGFATAILCAAEPPTDPQLKMELGMHSSMLWRVSTDSAGRYVLSCSDDKTGRLWDASSGELLKVYRVPSGIETDGRIIAGAISPDARFVALGGRTGVDWEGSYSIYLFDAQSGNLLQVLKGMNNLIEDIKFSSDGSLLGAVCAGTAGLYVWKAPDWSLLGKDLVYGGSSYSLDFARRDGRWIIATSAWDAKLRLYGVGSGLEKLGEYSISTGGKPQQVSFSPNGARLGVGHYEKPLVEVYDVGPAGFSFAFNPDLTGCSNLDLRSLAFSQDGFTLYAAGGWYSGGSNPLRAWANGGRGSYQDFRPGNGVAIFDIKTLSDGRVLVGAADPFWGIIDRYGSPISSSRSPISDFRDSQSVFKVNQDGRAVSFGLAYGGKNTVAFDVRQRYFNPDGSSFHGSAPDTSGLAVQDWKNSRSPKLNGKAIALQEYERSLGLAVAPDARSFVFAADWNIHCFSDQGVQLWKVPLNGTAWAVNVSGDGRLALAAQSDGTIRWYRMDNGKQVLALYPHQDKKRWILWTPSGYYDASPGAEDLIGWQLNNGRGSAADFFPASRFRQTYYRPDIISRVLETLDEAQAVALANDVAGRKDQSSGIANKIPPIVTILSPYQNDGFNGATVRVGYSLKAPQDAPVTGLRALVDGRPVQSMNTARDLVVGAVSSGLFIDVPVPSADCVVSLIAENKNGSSEASSVRLSWKGSDLKSLAVDSVAKASEARTEAFVILPKLYVLSVGVSDYQNPEYRLGYAAKDARDLGAALQRLKGGLYRDVEVKVLSDKAANKLDILDGLDWIQKQTTSKDVAVIFFAGHGLNDSSGKYYYLPYETDLEKLKRTGVPFSDITSTVASVSGKLLFFIDTCHSGNLMKGARAGTLSQDIVGTINELSSAENGAVVFSSSSGNQYSFEDPAWSNGAFTKAVIEGISGKAAMGSSQRITVNMLDLYISERVKELTKGKQTPTTTKPANVPDFPVALR